MVVAPGCHVAERERTASIAGSPLGPACCDADTAACADG